MIFKKLFEPIQVGSVVLKNRIAMAPISNKSLFSFSEGAITERCVEYYKERCKGGVGLIITGVFKVENEIEKESWPILTQNGLTRLAEVADYAHAYGARIFIQLSAGAGRNAKWVDKPVCASALPSFYRPDVTCKELTTDEVEKIVAAFGKAAASVLAAGIDGIEVHGHEGYLIDSFTTSLFNKRTDKYGGDLKGRLRVSMEILKAIRDAVGNNFPIIYRYGIKHFIRQFGIGALEQQGYDEAGRDIPEGIEMAKLLGKNGYDALDIDAGCYESLFWAHPPLYQPHGCYVDLLKDVKKNTNIPIVVGGKLDIPLLADKIIEEGRADIIAIGRGLLADPYWPNKVKGERINSIRPCIGCHEGCMERARIRSLSCSVNPSCGRELFYEMKKAEKIKKVLIAGGGLAGMEAARLGAIRGHNIILCEESDELGGHLVAGSIPDFKQDVKRLLYWYIDQLKELNVNIKLETEVKPKMVREVMPDSVIIATGSKPIFPEIPGMTDGRVVTCIDLLLGRKKPGNQVVIVGGGQVGCESAVWLAEKGVGVTIIEMLPQVGLAFAAPNRSMLLELLSKYNVKILTNATVQEVADDGVIVGDNRFNKLSITCDTVALAVGQKSRKELYKSLVNDFQEIYEIGDCKEPRNIHNTIWDSYIVGCLI